MSLDIYKWIQPSSRGSRIEYHLVDHSNPKSHPLVIYSPFNLGKRPPIFTTKGFAKDYGPCPEPSCYLDILVTSGISTDTIYREYNEIQDSPDHMLSDPPID